MILDYVDIRTCLQTLLLLNFYLYYAANSEIIMGPNNTEAVVGGTTYFICSTTVNDKDIHWYHTEIGSTQGRNLVYGYGQIHPPYNSRFLVGKNNVTGSYNLSISKVEIGDVGTYDCQDDAGSGAKASAELIILEKNPVCLVNMKTDEVIGSNNCGIEPSKLVLSCNAQYRGNEEPIMKWIDTGNGSIITEGVTQTESKNLVIYNLTINGDKLTDGSSIACLTSRSSTNPSGCDSGKIKITSKVVPACPSCSACKDCQSCALPVLCILLILFPIAICISVVATSYHPIQRPAIIGIAINRIRTISCRCKRCAKSKDEEVHETAPLNDSVEAKTERHRQIDQQQNDKVREDKTKSSLTFENHELKQREEKLKLESEQLTKQVEELKIEVQQQKMMVKELEQLRDPIHEIVYTKQPVFVHSIKLRAQATMVEKEFTSKGAAPEIQRKEISGMAILDQDLFIIQENYPVIEIFDSATFKTKGNFVVTDLTDPTDLVACKVNKCLYIAAPSIDNKADGAVFKVDPKNKSMIKYWKTDGRSGRLSTYVSDVIVCLQDKQTVNEYTSNGDFVKTVRLPAAQGLYNPWHAIKVSTNKYIVSHGKSGDKLHRVCLIDDHGDIKKEYRESTKMNVPICLAEDRGRNILVANKDHNQVILLSSQLEFKHKLVSVEKEDFIDKLFSKDKEKPGPVRIYLDGETDRLFVAVSEIGKQGWEGNQVLVFNVREAKK